MCADTVFISYSHDSPEHSDRVLALSDKLREMGVDVELDQYHVRPPQGWPHWYEERLRPENAKYVLVICTLIYRDRVESRVAADEDRAVALIVVIAREGRVRAGLGRQIRGGVAIAWMPGFSS